MGKFSPTIAPTTDKQLPTRRRKGSSDTPSANALRERVRAQNMKRAYLKLQKTLPQVPPDTKLPRLNILLMAIDYISHLRDVLHNDTCAAEENTSPHKVEEKCGMFRPFIEKWPIRCQLLSDFLRPQLDESQTRRQIAVKEK
ncbi:transcription factor 24-like [Stylophora pistillata]|uniref:Transcription factor 24 n=1 Tax=Stylophora pistillata TaxID=50429 RepID=A0A2B4RPL1_STYPI|nr:transcription factor 24-like [Stylophora pistillata]PFX18182.1 Transcription factor 24 [Stylophora pistillata]